jgi:hypothetical protein
LPFHGPDTISILASLALDNPPSPRQLNAEVTPGLSDLVMRLLAKDPVGRPPSARVVEEALTVLQTVEGSAITQTIPKAQPAPPAGSAETTAVLVALPAQPIRRQGGEPTRGCWWPIALVAAVALAVLGPLTYWFAPAILRIATNKGQLVIETDDPDVEVRVKRNGEQVTIVDAKTSKEITLQAGTYQLELVSGKEGLALSTKQFTLACGGREIVKVRLEAAAAPAPTRPTLLAPAPGAVLSNARPDNPVAWEFQWTAVPRATRYHLLVYGPSARVPLIDEDRLPGTVYRYPRKGYIADRNRKGWRWKVRARIDDAWGDWSDERSFDVEPLNAKAVPAKGAEVRPAPQPVKVFTNSIGMKFARVEPGVFLMGSPANELGRREDE